MEKAKVTVLPSGVRVATQVLSGAVTATCGIWAAAGSCNDRWPGAHGAAHFLEHLAFKGSAAHPQQAAMERAVEQRGTQLHAYTSREHSCYFARGLGADAAANTALVADLVLRPLHAPAKVDAERSTIVREMDEVAGVPEEVVLDMLHTCVFGRAHPFGRSILGTPASVRAIRRADLQEHLARCYTAPRTVFAAAGAVRHEDVVAVAQQYFPAPRARLTRRVRPFVPSVPAPVPVPADRAGAAARLFACAECPVVLDTNPQRGAARDPMCYAVVGAAGCADAAAAGARQRVRDHSAWLVLQALLGSSASSADAAFMYDPYTGVAAQLHARGLVRRAHTVYLPYSDRSVFGVYYEAPASAAREVCRAVVAEYARLARAGRLAPDELARAKQLAKRQLILTTTSTTAALCEELGRQCLLAGRCVPADALCRAIDALGVRDVQQHAWRALTARGRAPVPFALITTNAQQLLQQRRIPTADFVRSLSYDAL